MSFRWDSVLAARAVSIKPSPFVDLDDIRRIDDLIFFSGGAPPAEQNPAGRLRQAMLDAWEEADAIYSYGESKGHEPLRRLIADRLAVRSTSVAPDNIIITNGSQQGLDLIARALFDPGDVVIIEGPTYFGALQAFDAYEVRYRVVPVDDEGIIPDELERALSEDPRPKALYTVPIFQNPTGVTISPERQRRIVDLAREHNVVIIEDDPYGELRFDGEPEPPLRSLDPNVVYLGTFSKTLYPALRIGWMTVPPPLMPPVLDSKEAVDIQSDRFVQRAITRAASDGWLDHHLTEARALYLRRCEHMLAALRREMPEGVRWTQPAGGFFIWLTLPGNLTADALMPIAAEERVAYLPGSFFYPDRRPSPSLRLGFSTLSRERIDEGIARLGRAVSITLERV
jgi:2-aminoadipate transaminase